MNIRLISGHFGGRFLQAPRGHVTHPMGERQRGALFNILGDISDCTVLDAFAGTGSLGFEALSRGASRALFIEKDRVAGRVIRENIELLKVGDCATLFAGSVATWDESATGDSFDLIFVDPPYHDLQEASLRRLAKHVAHNGRLVLSLPVTHATIALDGLICDDVREYAGASLHFYHTVS